MAKSSFNFDKNSLDRLAGNFNKSYQKEAGKLLQKMTAITNIIYRTARAKRPQISAKEHKRLGKTLGAGGRRVSDPSAEAGVPVQIGTLQISITKEVKDNGKSITGTVFVDPNSPAAKYAPFLEYGTSRMQARPFMRPALMLNMELIKKTFEGKS